MVENLGPINISEIIRCYYKLESGINWTDYTDKKQTSLQYKEGEDIWTGGVGRSKGKEVEYDLLNPFFKGTIFEEIINTYDLKRTRLMWVSPKTCYSMHKDETPRVHVPIITYPDCYFIFKHRPPVHLPVGHVYKVDTRVFHTFANCTDNPRLHLVGVVKNY